MKLTPQQVRKIMKDYSAKRYKQLKDKDLLKVRPYWQYHHDGTQASPCHLQWSGLVLRHDDPWWDTHFPPNGPDCKCWVIAVRADKYTGQVAPLD